MKNTMNKKYRICDHISWTTDIHAVKVFDRNARQTTTIHYPEAAIWSFIQQGFAEEKMVTMLAAITKNTEIQAKKKIVGTLQKWVNEKFITK